jgi:hypothetical protein
LCPSSSPPSLTMASRSAYSMRHRIQSRLYRSPCLAAHPMPASLSIYHGATTSRSPCSSCESSPSSKILCYAQGSWLTSSRACRRRRRPVRRDDCPAHDPFCSGLCSVVLVFTYWIYCTGYHQ